MSGSEPTEESAEKRSGRPVEFRCLQHAPRDRRHARDPGLRTDRARSVEDERVAEPRDVRALTVQEDL